MSEKQITKKIKRGEKSYRRIVRTPEAAEYMDVSSALLERDRWRKGTIPFLKIGYGAVRYDLDTLDRYMVENGSGTKK